MSKQKFLEKVAPVIVKYAKLYGYNYPSAIIAQAVNESGWGDSALASKYNNFFGMKCGSRWNGKYTDMKTKEEYVKGVTTNIKAKFRAYDTIEDGVKGYFEFISSSRYANLKKATSARDYLERLKADGYATASTYVDICYNIWKVNELGKYDSVSSTDLDNALEVIARYVKQGEFGNGAERKEKLYKAVQEKVNA